MFWTSSTPNVAVKCRVVVHVEVVAGYLRIGRVGPVELERERDGGVGRRQERRGRRRHRRRVDDLDVQRPATGARSRCPPTRRGRGNRCSGSHCPIRRRTWYRTSSGSSSTGAETQTTARRPPRAGSSGRPAPRSIGCEELVRVEARPVRWGRDTAACRAPDRGR